MGKLFQFAVLIHPTTEEAKAGVSSKVIVDVTTVIATDQNSAILLAGREIPEEFMDKLERVEVVIRPF